MILISPYAKKLRNKDKLHPKNYPYWKELISLLGDYHIIQLGVPSEEKIVEDFRTASSLQDLINLLLECKVWVSVDNFFPHFAHHYNKSGIVIWSQSDPLLFGYPENINILKSRDYLRNNQFGIWEDSTYNIDAYEKPEVIAYTINNIYKRVSNA